MKYYIIYLAQGIVVDVEMFPSKELRDKVASQYSVSAEHGFLSYIIDNVQSLDR